MKARQKGAKANAEAAAARAADLTPMIAELQASDATSLRAIASALNDRGIPTARGGSRRPSVTCSPGSETRIAPPVRSDRTAGGATSLRQIAALNARGISAPRGGQWHGTSVRNVMARA
jgi:hypothetical protein